MVRHAILAVIGFAFFGTAITQAAEEFSDVEPFWVLLHEPAAVAELKLSAEQQRKYQSLLDEFDLKFFPLRNKSPKEAQPALAKLVAEVKPQVQAILKPSQSERLTQLLLWRLGISSVLQEEAAKRIGYSKSQRMRLEDVLYDTQLEAEKIEKQVQAGEPRKPLEKKYQELQTSGQKKLLQILKPEQQTAWKELLGPQFNLKKFGVPQYMVPELVTTDGWINSPPLKLSEQRGKVVVVHFYACGCSNCIANYPSYKAWQERFAGKDVVMIGIHSPETAAERDLSHVKKKAAEAKLTFPILLDAKSENWNRWGNSMWPTVYVIDKRGYLRNVWPGELQWQGATGDKILAEKIEQYLDEPVP